MPLLSHSNIEQANSLVIQSVFCLRSQTAMFTTIAVPWSGIGGLYMCDCVCVGLKERERERERERWGIFSTLAWFELAIFMEGMRRKWETGEGMREMDPQRAQGDGQNDVEKE